MDRSQTCRRSRRRTNAKTAMRWCVRRISVVRFGREDCEWTRTRPGLLEVRATPRSFAKNPTSLFCDRLQVGNNLLRLPLVAAIIFVELAVRPDDGRTQRVNYFCFA